MDSDLPGRHQAKCYTCGRYLAEYSKDLLLGLALFNIFINDPVNGLHSPLIKLADATQSREHMKGKRRLKREGKMTEKSRKKGRRKSPKLFVMMKFGERWLEDYSKPRFFNCGFIHNPVKINYESQREMGQKVRLEFAGRGGRRAGTTARALLTHGAGMWGRAPCG